VRTKNRPLAQMDAHGADEDKQQYAEVEVLHGEHRLDLLLMLGFSPFASLDLYFVAVGFSLHSTSAFNSVPPR